jgi:formate hydrogenlyase subunit 3/multisubunit Na+/H+ antiporter MnhD subunit
MNINVFLNLLIFTPMGMGVIIFLIPEKVKIIRKILAFLTTGCAFALSIFLFINHTELSLTYTLIKAGYIELIYAVRTTPFAMFLILFLTFIGFCITVYSLAYMKGKKKIREYYSFLLVTVGAGCGVLLSNNLILLLIFWEIVSISLYFLIATGKVESKNGATKTMVMIGSSDACLLMGIGLIWYLSKTMTISAIQIPLDNALAYLAFFLVLIGALTKAGSMPLHTWIPAASEGAPSSVMAFLPGALDKLLGIYLLAIITIQLFSQSFAISLVLMILGSVTILASVMMALVQHDLPKLLSYHAISQVGYMVLGIGTMNPIGIAGGLFHMLNNTLYKSTLFLCGGAVESKTGTQELNKLGGLAKVMPFTFIACIIAAFSISGIPPFNGFVSKWMVYQGTIDSPAHQFSYLFLIAAMFGSGLTLASFVKVLYSIFLGRKSDVTKNIKKDAGPSMVIPMLALAFICILFGVVPNLPLQNFIYPAIERMNVMPVVEKGTWNAQLATIFIICGLIIGLIIYIIGNMRRASKKVSTFTGGEVIDSETIRIPGTTMYNEISTMNPLKPMYAIQKKGFFDLYEIFGKIGTGISTLFQRIHNGYLPVYLSWTVLGLIIIGILFFFL